MLQIRRRRCLLLTLIILMVIPWTGCDGPQVSETEFWSRPAGWVYEDSTLWTLTADTLSLIKPGGQTFGIRRPGALATVANTGHVSSFQMRASVASSQDTTVVGRDLILVFGYRSEQEFYYAHLSNDNTIMPHNGIFLVDHADRRRIDDQGVAGQPEERLTDTRWHNVRLERDADGGQIRVFMDDMRRPLLTATDTTFASGAIGFGSFDDTGSIRNVHFAEGPLPVLDPVDGHPEPARLAIQLEPFARIPASDTTGGPMARINFLSGVQDGSDRLFVPDLRGNLYVIQHGNVQVYLEVAERFSDFVGSPGLGSGLGFVAFHPEFAANGLFYTVHTEGGRALTDRRPDYRSREDIIQGVVTEWKAADPSASVFDGTHREVMRLGFEAVLHGIQQIGFNPLSSPGDNDYGLLYLAVGDGQAPGAQTNAPQRLDAHNGKILRIDPAGTDSPNGGYGVPHTNPFSGEKDVLGEIWAFGLRNPHRFSWDPATGRMLIGHIGEARVDAVFQGREGANYGWNEREGGFRFERADPLEVYPVTGEEERERFEDPLIRLDHDELSALVGGFVYRGRAVPDLSGFYVFGDLASGQLFESNIVDMTTGQPDGNVHYLAIQDASGKEVAMSDLAGRSRAEIRFGQDANGELYILSKANGQIWRIVDAVNLLVK